jgi:hypothetical protein
MDISDEGADALDEISPVTKGLKTDEVIAQKRSHKLEPPREPKKDVERGEGDMQKKPDILLYTQLPEFMSYIHEVIIVNPDVIAFSEVLFNHLGELAVDLLITRPIGGIKVASGGKVMKKGPTDLVSKSAIVFLFFLRRDGDRFEGKTRLLGEACENSLQHLARSLSGPWPADP